MIKKVAVLGATSDQGIPLVSRLLAGGFQVTAVVRSPEKLQALGLSGISIVVADIGDEQSLIAAFEGQDALALHLPFVHDRNRARAMGAGIARAARAAQLKKIVFNTSSYVADHDLGLEAHDGRRAIERSFSEVSLPFISIRPMVFMDNLQRRWLKPSIVEKGIFAYPAAPDLRISWISIDDVAAYMVAALRRDDLVNARIPVGGPEALTGDAVARRLGHVLNRPVRFLSLAPETFAADMSELVTGSRVVEKASVYAGMARFYAWYNAQPQSPLALSCDGPAMLPEVTPRSLEDWARGQEW